MKQISEIISQLQNIKDGLTAQIEDINKMIDGLTEMSKNPPAEPKKEWDGVIRMSDLKFETYHAPDKHIGFMPVSPTGVSVVHIPTGIQVCCHKHRTAHFNKCDAHEALLDRLNTLAKTKQKG